MWCTDTANKEPHLSPSRFPFLLGFLRRCGCCCSARFFPSLHSPVAAVAATIRAVVAPLAGDAAAAVAAPVAADAAAAAVTTGGAAAAAPSGDKWRLDPNRRKRRASGVCTPQVCGQPKVSEKRHS